MFKHKHGVCEKCQKRKRLTNHHLYPKRFFGEIGPIKRLCRECHDLLETFIPTSTVMPKYFYEEIYDNFLRETFSKDDVIPARLYFHAR